MPYNSKSKANLVPFKKGKDPRRQPGRKRGSLNMGTIIKTLLSENISPDYIFSAEAKERFLHMKDKTLLEAITITLVNQSLCGNTQASNIILREMRKIEEKEPSSKFFSDIRNIKITVVNPQNEPEQPILENHPESHLRV